MDMEDTQSTGRLPREREAGPAALPRRMEDLIISRETGFAFWWPINRHWCWREPRERLLRHLGQVSRQLPALVWCSCLVDAPLGSRSPPRLGHHPRQSL